jgi:dTDP-4-dehydrorhamnose reductase
MKLLITGSNGFVAGSIIAQAPADWEVHGIARSAPAVHSYKFTHHLVDLLDKEKLAECFSSIKPDVVIHTAAMANIDCCQNNPSIAHAINVEATRSLASLCEQADIKLIHCSTDTVFDGKKGFYVEEDEPNPINYYAETKLEAEKIVLASSTKNVVARLALVMGLPVIGKGNSFLADIMGKLKNKEEMKFAQNEIRTPINVISLGAALIELAQIKNVDGILHLAGNTRIDRYQMAREIATTLGFSPEMIIPTNSNNMVGRAPRPNDASMDNAKATRLLKTPLLSLTEGLSLILTKKYEQY